MKFAMQNEEGVNLVRAVAPGQLRVREHDIRSSVILTADRIVFDWPPRAVSALSRSDLDAALVLAPEVILLGTGEQQEFPDPEIARAIQAAGVGFEVMDTRAACRTYNLLVQEGRRVAAAILMDPL
jgi:uncharacterized protein